MDRATFHALYEKCPPGFKAELIGGIVYVPSPTKFGHGRPHSRVAQWLGEYADATAGFEMLLESTHFIDEANEPEPDAVLRVDEEYGGQTRETGDGYIAGPPELVAEVANTSATIDLHRKRDEYEAAGVKEYVVLVRTRQVVWHVRGRKGFVELPPGDDGVYRSRTFPGLWLDPTAAFHKTGRRILSVLRQGLASPEHAAFVAKLEAKAAKRKRT